MPVGLLRNGIAGVIGSPVGAMTDEAFNYSEIGAMTRKAVNYSEIRRCRRAVDSSRLE